MSSSIVYKLLIGGDSLWATIYLWISGR